MDGVFDDSAVSINGRIKKSSKFQKVRKKLLNSFSHHKLALMLLGWKCVWPDCNCIDPDKNQIDHIFNDGKSERGQDLARKIIDDYLNGVDVKFRYQVLCKIHNLRKHFLNRERAKMGVTPITIL